MSDYSAVAPPQQAQNSNFKSQAFAAALQRAKQIAAKINPGGTNSESGTKRPLDDGQEPESKKLATTMPPRPAMGPIPGLPMGPVTSEDIKVPDKMVGLIIGRGGEQITRLQSESGCKIQMAPDSGGAPERICTLNGTANSIARAKELINAIVHQRFKTEGPVPRGMDDIVNNSHNPNNPSFVEIMIPGSKVGLIIGKGGETIKTLQEKSGAKMVVIQDGPNQETEKPLRITGDPHKVEQAKTLVYELLAEKEGGGPRGGGGGGGFPGGRVGGGPGGRFLGRGESTYIVPANKCGVVIGRGGETIKQINQATGAHCELDRRPNNNPNEKVFVIRGTQEQIEAAKQMISEKLGQGPQPGMGGGQPGGPPGYSQYTGWQQPYQPPYQPDQGGMNAVGPGGGQPDYSQQWIEYYRSVGMHSEADAVEAQMKAKQAAAGGAPGAGGVAASAAPASQNGQPDYSVQWAQYYRSIGKIKEAEIIEQQMKAKGQGSGGGGYPGAAPAAAPYPAAYAPAAPTPGFYQPPYYQAGGYPGYQPPPPSDQQPPQPHQP